MSGALLGVVLCGGQSTRMGQEKAALVHVKFDTFLHHAIARLKPLCGEVVVSGKTSVVHSQLTIDDAVEHQGPIQGIAASLRHAAEHNAEAVLVTAVDMPDLTTDDLKLIVNAWKLIPQLTVPSSGRVEPLAAIYPVSTLPDIEACIDRGQRSLIRWIESTPHQKVVLPDGACRNVNTPDDY